MEEKKLLFKKGIILNSLYFFRVDELTSGRALKVYEINDFEKYKYLCDKGLKELNNEESELLRQLFTDCKEAELEKGDYLVDSETIHWEFSIDLNKQLTGVSCYKDIVDEMTYNLIFKEGVAVQGMLTVKGNLVSKFVCNNDVVCMRHFNEDRLLVSETEIFNNLRDQENIIYTSFYKDGRIKKVENSIDYIISSYFENGKLESVQNLKESWSKFYAESGLLCSEMYCKEDTQTVVTYFNGIITEKSVMSEEQNTYYHFKGGLLSSYEVCNNATKEVVCYGNDGNVLCENSIIHTIT